MKCPNIGCDNNGTIPDHEYDCNGECECCPVPTACEWCYTNEDSDMNIRIRNLAHDTKSIIGKEIF